MPKFLQFIEMQVNVMVQQIIDPITVIPVEPEIFKLFIINYRNTDSKLYFQVHRSIFCSFIQPSLYNL